MEGCFSGLQLRSFGTGGYLYRILGYSKAKALVIIIPWYQALVKDLSRGLPISKISHTLPNLNDVSLGFRRAHRNSQMFHRKRKQLPYALK